MKIQIQRKGFLLLLISVFLLWRRVESIRFDLESGHTKCISEDIKSNSMTVGKYNIVNPNDGHPLPESHKITVRVIFYIFFLSWKLFFLDFDINCAVSIFCFFSESIYSRGFCLFFQSFAELWFNLAGAVYIYLEKIMMWRIFKGFTSIGIELVLVELNA